MKCSECEIPARMAIRTTRPSRADMRITIFADDRFAPRTATRYCHAHGRALVADLVDVLVDQDD